ncbi:MAG: hypothetical protein M3Z13_01060 [Candidatus Dormibacteraeota bacterium]|nr:hypothetical protein [Candidatus Dormibacteraeota bacterium]
MASPLGRSHRAVAVLAVLCVTALAVAPALAASSVSAARGSTRSALVSAFAAYDGSRAGVSSVYVLSRHTSLGVVCDHTADAGTVGFVFQHSGRRWRYVTRGNHKAPAGLPSARTLERACH